MHCEEHFCLLCSSTQVLLDWHKLQITVSQLFDKLTNSSRHVVPVNVAIRNPQGLQGLLHLIWNSNTSTFNGDLWFQSLELVVDHCSEDSDSTMSPDSSIASEPWTFKLTTSNHDRPKASWIPARRGGPEIHQGPSPDTPSAIIDRSITSTKLWISSPHSC